MFTRFLLCLFFGLVTWPLVAQEAPKTPAKDPDVLIFADGEKLIGHLVKSSGASVTFKSDMAGEVTVEWAKVKELRTADQFAVIPKTVKLVRKEVPKDLPQGTLAVADQKIQVTPKSGGAPETVPVAEAGNVVSAAEFEKAMEGEPGFFRDWKGGVTGGVSLVEATQKSQVFTGALALVRAEPTENWLAARDRTIVNFAASYGKISQPGQPNIKTEIYHGDAERDEYFSPRFYAFAGLAFDHNFSQGLDLQQLYGGGIGWTMIKEASQQLDLRMSANYIRQSFTQAGDNKNLIGSTFSDTYMRKLPLGMVFNQALTFTPAWNNTSAYSALGSAALIFPTYKRLGISLTVLDTFLNDPPAGFKKNSFQLTAGLTYTIK